MALYTELARCVDDLAVRIDEAQEAAQRRQWQRFWDGALPTGYFTPPGRQPAPPRCDWPDLHPNDNRILHDPQTMVLAQFKRISDLLARGANSALGVRPNYGVGILSSQLGCRVIEMPEGQFNTPTTEALGGAMCSEDERLDAIRRCIDAGGPDVYAAQGGDALRCAEVFAEVFDRWPVVGRWVELYHPDTQGPIDNAELAWGSDIFVAFYDQAELVHRFLDLMTEHYITYLTKWYDTVPSPDGEVFTHWDLMHRGRVMLRDDSLMNLSNETYCTFIRDREARCLRELGGGAIHFCGRGDHFIESMSAMQADGLTAINMSQPHLNDMEVIYRNTVDKGLRLVGLPSGAAAQSVAAGRDLRGMVQCAEGGQPAF